MEKLDQQKLKRVWSRVEGQHSPDAPLLGFGEAGSESAMPPLREKPDLLSAAALLRQSARDCHLLSRQLRGRQAALLQKLSRQAWEGYRALQQLLGNRE